MQKLAGMHHSLIQQMFASSEAVFIRAMCKAISSWDGYPGSLTKVIRIHGEKDKVIKCSCDCHVTNAGAPYCDHSFQGMRRRAIVELAAGRRKMPFRYSRLCGKASDAENAVRSAIPTVSNFSG
jgi:hypothetical protein